jgi:hypothetical protein
MSRYYVAPVTQVLDTLEDTLGHELGLLDALNHWSLYRCVHCDRRLGVRNDGRTLGQEVFAYYCDEQRWDTSK